MHCIVNTVCCMSSTEVFFSLSILFPSFTWTFHNALFSHCPLSCTYQCPTWSSMHNSNNTDSEWKKEEDQCYSYICIHLKEITRKWMPSDCSEKWIDYKQSIVYKLCNAVHMSGKLNSSAEVCVSVSVSVWVCASCFFIHSSEMK